MKEHIQPVTVGALVGRKNVQQKELVDNPASNYAYDPDRGMDFKQRSSGYLEMGTFKMIKTFLLFKTLKTF